MVEWISARLDLTRTTAHRLLELSRTHHHDISQALAEGEMSFERTSGTLRLANSGYPDALETTAGLDIGALRLFQQPLSGDDEGDQFGQRGLVLQPRFDESQYTGWLQLPGTDARVVETALLRRAERLGHTLPDGTTPSRSQLPADSLLDMAIDDLAIHPDNGHQGQASPATTISVFVDTPHVANPTADDGGEPVARLDNGIRIGPEALQQLICNGARIELNSATHPLGIGRAGRAVPPRLRRKVLHRDLGVCSIDGCHSTYRLEAHHLIHWEDGGETEEDNLITLCWFHHHVVIHRYGYRIDPESPPLRRRFLRRALTRRGPPP